MAKKKVNRNPYPAIARPMLKDELDSKRVHFKDLSREELEDLLIRAANKIEGLESGYAHVQAELRERIASMRKGPDSRLASDEKQSIRKECEKKFSDRISKRPIQRGDRAQFISDMADEYPIIEDARTFGGWWDVWKKQLGTVVQVTTQPAPELIAYWRELDRLHRSMPKILQTLGYIPKNRPPWPGQ